MDCIRTSSTWHSRNANRTDFAPRPSVPPQPKFIPAFIKTMDEEGVDIVTGTRYKPGGGVFGWDLRRKLTSRVANYLADLMLSPQVSVTPVRP
jgi:hypothetical protein